MKFSFLGFFSHPVRNDPKFDRGKGDCQVKGFINGVQLYCSCTQLVLLPFHGEIVSIHPVLRI